MHECNNCSKTMLFGGRTIEGYRYCGHACAHRHPLLRSAERIPANVLQQHVEQWRNSPCPRCSQQQGPIDVYAHHRVHSFILMTQWNTKKSICCRRCGRNEQIKSALYSVVLGWWGIPWGLLATPIQVTRNLAGIFQRQPARASADFERVVRMQLAQQIQQADQAGESFSAQG